jgi:hypothetical protein
MTYKEYLKKNNMSETLESWHKYVKESTEVTVVFSFDEVYEISEALCDRFSNYMELVENTEDNSIMDNLDDFMDILSVLKKLHYQRYRECSNDLECYLENQKQNEEDWLNDAEDENDIEIYKANIESINDALEKLKR